MDTIKKKPSEASVQFAGKFVPGNKKKRRFGEKGTEDWFRMLPIEPRNKK